MMKAPSGIPAKRWQRLSTLGHRPSPKDIQDVRTAVGYSRERAAALLLKGVRTWSKWESGARGMDPVLWHFWLQRLDPPQKDVASRAG